MSGGAFDYVCTKLDSTSILDMMPQLRDMERYLRSIDKQLAADEVFKFILELETAQRHITIIGNRLHDVIKATEWVASGDWREDHIDAAVNELLNPAK